MTSFFIDTVDIQKLHNECFPSMWLHFAYSFAAGLAAVLFITGLYWLRTSRYYLKTLYCMLRYEQRAPTTDKTCYVTYASGDDCFIQSILIPGLESTYNFKLFVPDRDFVGSDEVDEILDGN